MYHNDVMNLLIQVAKSWQVLAMTAALVLYMALVNYVARTYRQPRFVSKSMPRKSRPKAPRKAKSDGPVVTKDGDSNEALGLEEK